MVPDFKIFADNADITHRIKQRLMSIKTVDKVGFESDTLSITLDDRDEQITTPQRGVKLSVWLGYKNAPLTKIGIYTVDEVLLSGFPQTLIIKAKAADMRAEFKAQKTRSFDNITLGELTALIAQEHELKPTVNADISSTLFAHIDQTQESNLHLLTRLAKQHNNTIKVTHDSLIVTPAGNAQLSTIHITKKQLNTYDYAIADRGKYKAVIGRWYDKQAAKDIEEKTSDQTPAYTLRHTFDNAKAAALAAKDRLTQLQQSSATLSLTLGIGNPAIFAETPLKVSGVRADITAPTWTTNTVNHSFSPPGFTTSINSTIKA